MTHFINKVVKKDDPLLHVTGLHWIYVVKSIILCSGFLLVGYGLDTVLLNTIGYEVFAAEVNLFVINFIIPPYPLSIFSGVAGGICLLFMLARFWGTEVGVTHKYLIYKTGILIVDVHETAIEEIRGEDVDHGILGSILGYGRIKMDCRFIDDVLLPAVFDPYGLVNALNTAREAVDRESSSKVEFLNKKSKG